MPVSLWLAERMSQIGDTRIFDLVDALLQRLFKSHLQLAMTHELVQPEIKEPPSLSYQPHANMWLLFYPEW